MKESDLKISQYHKAHVLQKQCKDINFHTECKKSLRLSEQYNSNIFLKREDQLPVRMYKMRGIYNKMMNMTEEQKACGVVCASDGNLAQSVAYFCNYFKVEGNIYIPEVCFQWKVDLIRKYGKEWVKIRLSGENIDSAERGALQHVKEHGSVIIHSYDDYDVFYGNGSMAIEIIEDMPMIDYLLVPIGRGSLVATLTYYFKQVSPMTKIIGVEPLEAAAMTAAFQKGEICRIEKLSRFCDGSAVGFASNIGYAVCKQHLDKLLTVPDGKVSTTILKLYEQGIPVEPAGALSVSCLDQLKDEIQGKNVVCIISGATVDLSRFDEFKEFSLLYEGLKQYLLINLPLKQGIIREFVTTCLAPEDEISHMQFSSKPNRERGPLLVAINMPKKENMDLIEKRMQQQGYGYKILNKTMGIYDLLV